MKLLEIISICVFVLWSILCVILFFWRFKKLKKDERFVICLNSYGVNDLHYVRLDFDEDYDLVFFIDGTRNNAFVFDDFKLATAVCNHLRFIFPCYCFDVVGI